MNRLYVYQILTLVFMFLVCSCVETIDLDTNEDRIVVVNGILTQDEEQSLTLCWSSKNETPFSPKPGETYTIRIQGSGFEEVSASTIMPGDAKVSVWGYPHDMFCEAYFSLRIGKCVGIEVVSEDAESLLWLYVFR